MQLGSCDKCRAKAIIYQNYSGMHLCSAHFEEDVHRKIRESIRQTGIFARPARVAVALGGGMDSSTLLYALKTIFSSRRDIQLIAVMIDEGSDGARQNDLHNARMLAERLNVPYVIERQKNAADFPAGIEPDQVEQTACRSNISRREKQLGEIALNLKADALATGRNLDDEALSVLQSYLKGDIDGLFGLKRHRTGDVPIIKPLRRVPGKETAIYATEHGLLHPGCRGRLQAEDAMSIAVKKMLDEFEARHPGTMYSLLRSLDRLMDLPQNYSLQGKSL